MAAPGAFAAVLAQADSVRAPALTQALALHGKVPLADASRRALTSWGILLEQASEDAALELAGALSAAGVQTLVLPQDRLAPPPPAQQAGAAALDKTLLRFALKPGPGSVELQPGEVVLVAAVVYHQGTRTVKKIEGPSPGQRLASLGIMMATGLPIHIGGKKREVEKTARSDEVSFQLELLARTPPRRVRIDAEAFNFACLGPKMQCSGQLNLRVLLALLHERLPSARLNLGARFLLESRPVNTMGYESPADLEREEKWLLALGSAG